MLLERCGTFMNTGQVCLGTEPGYVERPIFERFVVDQNPWPAAVRPPEICRESTVP